MSGQVNVKNLTGGAGGEVVVGPRTVTGMFQTIQAIDAVTLGAVSTNIDQTTDSLTGIVIPAGVSIFGTYKSVEITAGTAILYAKE